MFMYKKVVKVIESEQKLCYNFYNDTILLLKIFDIQKGVLLWDL